MTEWAQEYRVLDVSDWTAVEPEQMGTKAKEWLAAPDDQRWLFKEVREKVMPSGQLRAFGEDWSEKLASELARLLGVPSAVVELAQRSQRRGVVSRTVLSDRDHALVHGNELLQQYDPAYDRDQVREVKGYRLTSVWQVLDGHLAPAGAPAGIHTAVEVFAGYLLLDALIANRDRHHENWAVVLAPDGRSWLSPSYDHATSLGFQVEAQDKIEMLESRAGPTIEQWAAKGTSSHFEGKPSLVALAADALSRLDAASADVWYDRLAALDMASWQLSIDRVPAELMSHGDRIFGFELVRVNRERLLACLPR